VCRIVLGLFLFGCLIVQAQPPAIEQNGVVNAASNIPPTLPGGALARGAKFRVEGVRLSGEPVAILITRATASARARILSASPRQVDAIVPDNAPLGEAELVVRRASEGSAPYAVTIVSANPGLFSRNGAGWGPGRIRNLGGTGSSENSTSQSAQPLERIALAASGIGAAPVAVPDVFIGGKSAQVISAKHSIDPGEDEIVVEVPSSAPEGCFVPVYAQQKQMPPSNVVTVAIRRGGGACQMLGAPVGRRAGTIVLARSSMLDRHGRISVSDEAAAAFVDTAGEPALSRIALTPPVGTCTAYTGSYQSSFTMASSISASLLSTVGKQGLDVGDSIVLRRGEETREVPRTHSATGLYSARLGGRDWRGVSALLPLFFEPGEYLLGAPGGRDAGPFKVPGGPPAPFVWTNRDAVAEIDRTRPLTLTWSPVRLDQAVLIVATSVDQLTTATAMFYCLVSGLQNQFTIPQAMLANFPITQNVPGLPLTQLVVGSLTARTDLQAGGASGLDTITVVSLFANMRTVVFR
jgi:uncharacterized protein (TIGR03437 family)